MKKINLKVLKIVILGLAGFTVLIGVGYLMFSWNKPLNPALELPTESPEIVIRNPN